MHLMHKKALNYIHHFHISSDSREKSTAMAVTWRPKTVIKYFTSHVQQRLHHHGRVDSVLLPQVQHSHYLALHATHTNFKLIL